MGTQPQGCLSGQQALCLCQARGLIVVGKRFAPLRKARTLQIQEGKQSIFSFVGTCCVSRLDHRVYNGMSWLRGTFHSIRVVGVVVAFSSRVVCCCQEEMYRR